ncbi:CapA family protein [bacterium]|nr:CapA family protein [bacterium]
MKIKNSPYNLRETFGYFKRNYLGPVSKNRGLVSYAPESFALNPGIESVIRIGFIGDIMDMAGRDLCMGEALKSFFEDCDVLIGNFEATITTAKGAYMAQRHKPQILEALAELFPPEKTALSMANNHAGDFGYEIWSASRTMVEERGFQVFGTVERPAAFLPQDVCVVGGTRWTNQPCDYIVMVDAVTDYLKPGQFNILYPHWGYELELFPRPETVRLGEQWLQRFEAVIGHHSHTPQPVSVVSPKGETGSGRQLIAFGLGDFCIWETLRHYHFGQVLKIEIGTATDGSRLIGQVAWRFTACQPKGESVWETEITNVFPYLDLQPGG